jgi:hypothetical protein
MDKQNTNDDNPVEIFQDGERWVARHKDFIDFSGAGDTADEAVFELMSILENQQSSLDDETC